MMRSGLPSDEDADPIVDSSYGFPVTRNPLDFEPDEECCTEAEIARWKADCELAMNGAEVADPREGTTWTVSEDRKAVLHIDTTAWGIGVSNIRASAYGGIEEARKWLGFKEIGEIPVIEVEGDR